MARRASRRQPIKVIFEPGRSIVGDTGVLLTVEFLKHGEEKNFCIVDAAMNDMARPALYQAWMDMQPVVQGQSDARRTTWSARSANRATGWRATVHWPCKRATCW
jgi:diaminopimelate decarboxylase